MENYYVCVQIGLSRKTIKWHGNLETRSKINYVCAIIGFFGEKRIEIFYEANYKI